MLAFFSPTSLCEGQPLSEGASLERVTYPTYTARSLATAGSLSGIHLHWDLRSSPSFCRHDEEVQINSMTAVSRLLAAVCDGHAPSSCLSTVSSRPAPVPMAQDVRMVRMCRVILCNLPRFPHRGTLVRCTQSKLLFPMNQEDSRPTSWSTGMGHEMIWKHPLRRTTARTPFPVTHRHSSMT